MYPTPQETDTIATWRQKASRLKQLLRDYSELYLNMQHIVDKSIIRQLDEALIRVLLSDTAQQQFTQGKIGQRELKPFADLISGLSEQYRKDKELTSVSEREAAAYALYYTPINFIKVCFLLAQLPTPSNATLRILDFGCGPGTASLAALSCLDASLDITAIDSSPAMRSLASCLVKEFASGHQALLRAKLLNIASASDLSSTHTSFDIIIAANVLNELPEDERHELANMLISRLSQTGTLILLEPALLEPTRSLMQLRDSLLGTHPSIVPLFPCTHRNNCPMLQQSADDWCHGSLEGMGRDFESSELVRQLDSILGFNKHRIKYAAFIFQNNGATPSGYRVLRDATVEKRGVSLSICGSSHFGSAILPKKSLPENSRSIRKARQFDLISLPGLPNPNLIQR